MNIEQQFSEIRTLINQAKEKAFRHVNKELISLYWSIGRFIYQKVQKAEWGDNIVVNLADYLKKTEPELKGFSAQNLWRMKQFYEAYMDNPKLSTLSREISWSHNLLILSAAKTNEERAFYMQFAIRERLSFRELERQINSGIFERSIQGNEKLSTVLKETYPNASIFFKDNYVLDFLGLQTPFSEQTLRKEIIKNLKNFILEFGKDFTFIGDEYRLQVGKKDFYIDLLFYHRELQCLVAIELKITEFKPEYIGKMEFYLEALDRDIKKSHENPSVGIILCKSKDSQVVEYALSRTISPALVAKYETKLIDKKLLTRKLDEFFEQADNNENN
jgi:predicted nuclease of restriction endonuclease-like (RecB) superfamily